MSCERMIIKLTVDREPLWRGLAAALRTMYEFAPDPETNAIIAENLCVLDGWIYRQTVRRGLARLMDGRFS
ncbi:MAG: hypothetical protein M1438_04850 [Deltaproteobacteria bacterium]|nr:hypothetical protein [Deltaproteobacteria bacterium]